MLLYIMPTMLKQAVFYFDVIPVYKAGPTYQSGNYRLISLLLSMSNIFERLIL